VFEEWFWPYGPRKPEPSPLRRARFRIGLSQDEMAAAVGVSRKTIWSLESGRSSPSLELARALARKLERPLDELFPPP
jgi:putative transcriptional regulator